GAPRARQSAGSEEKSHQHQASRRDRRREPPQRWLWERPGLEKARFQTFQPPPENGEDGRVQKCRLDQRADPPSLPDGKRFRRTKTVRGAPYERPDRPADGRYERYDQKPARALDALHVEWDSRDAVRQRIHGEREWIDKSEE